MRLTPTRNGDHHLVEKRWGDETWIENGPEYCGKILRFKRGRHTSMHFHIRKMETMFCASGLIELILVDPETGQSYSVTLEPGDSLLIPRGQPHEIIGRADESILIEFSTQHFDDDSYRVSPPG